jgi:hypothetical protein
MKVIETNISYVNGIIGDHQSRVIDISSWDDYVDMFRLYDGKADGDFYNAFGDLMNGYTLPSGATINSLIYDEHHLSCEVNSIFRTIKLAYLIQ